MNQLTPRCASIWGLPARFTSADLPRTQQTEAVSILTQVSATTLSPAVNSGCHGVKLVVDLENENVVCDLELYQVVGGVDTLVLRWTAVGLLNKDALYAANLQLVDLNGNPIKVKVVNPIGGWVSVGYHKQY